MPTRPTKTRSFYAQVLAEKEQDRLYQARHFSNLDDDLALARLATQSVAARIPADPHLLLKSLDTIARLESVRRRCAVEPDMTAFAERTQQLVCSALGVRIEDTIFGKQSDETNNHQKRVS